METIWWSTAYAVMGYVAFVGIAELLIGYIQPDMTGGVMIITTDNTGNPTERNLARFTFDNKLYVSSNHWLRGWYYQARERPEVEVVVDGVRAQYTAIAIEGAELATLKREYKMGFILRFICGFAPSRFLRLEPKPAAGP